MLPCLRGVAPKGSAVPGQEWQWQRRAEDGKEPRGPSLPGAGGTHRRGSARGGGSRGGVGARSPAGTRDGAAGAPQPGAEPGAAGPAGGRGAGRMRCGGGAAGAGAARGAGGREGAGGEEAGPGRAAYLRESSARRVLSAGRRGEAAGERPPVGARSRRGAAPLPRTAALVARVAAGGAAPRGRLCPFPAAPLMETWRWRLRPAARRPSPRPSAATWPCCCSSPPPPPTATASPSSTRKCRRPGRYPPPRGSARRGGASRGRPGACGGAAAAGPRRALPVPRWMRAGAGVSARSPPERRVEEPTQSCWKAQTSPAGAGPQGGFRSLNVARGGKDQKGLIFQPPPSSFQAHNMVPTTGRAHRSLSIN